MEYYVYLTQQCNLRCSYCYFDRQEKNWEWTGERLEGLANFMVSNRSGGFNNICFIGGEPTLRPDLISRIMDMTEGKGFSYTIQTNGTLLNSLDKALLAKLDYVLLSVDGDHRTHDRFRGSGTFERIIGNVFGIRKDFSGKIIARMTLTQQNPLYQSVLGVVHWFDAVYWQLENSPSAVSGDFLANYGKDLDRLIDFWVGHLEAGIVKNIIPFSAVSAPLLFNENHGKLQCGCGHSYMAITPDGSCHACDELIDDENAKLGDIFTGIDFGDKYSLTERDALCRKCVIKNVCGGRCYHCSTYGAEKRRFYCSSVKMLVGKISKQLPRLQNLIDEKVIEKSAFTPELNRLVEQIP